MASYAAPVGNNYELSSLTGKLRDQAFSSINRVGEKYKDNETIGGLVTGTYLDDAKTTLNTANALAYNDAMQESTYKYSDALRTGDVARASQLAAVEGGVQKDLIGAQGDQTRLNLNTTGSENRLTNDNERDNTIALRNDARQAIDRTNQVLYGGKGTKPGRGNGSFSGSTGTV
jgi:hypothetical protein